MINQPLGQPREQLLAVAGAEPRTQPARKGTLTPNPRERRQPTIEERETLARFARSEIGLDDLLRRLRGMIEIEFGVEERRLVSHFLRAEPGIRVELADVEQAMKKHWRGDTSDEALYRWAVMLMLNEAYVWDGPDQEKIADTLSELAMLPPAHE